MDQGNPNLREKRFEYNDRKEKIHIPARRASAGKGFSGARKSGWLTGTADCNIPHQCCRLSFPLCTAAVDQGWCEKQQTHTGPQSSANEITSRLAVSCWPPPRDSTGSTRETLKSKAALVNTSVCESWAAPPAWKRWDDLWAQGALPQSPGRGDSPLEALLDPLQAVTQETSPSVPVQIPPLFPVCHLPPTPLPWGLSKHTCGFHARLWRASHFF